MPATVGRGHASVPNQTVDSNSLSRPRCPDRVLLNVQLNGHLGNGSCTVLPHRLVGCRGLIEGRKPMAVVRRCTDQFIHPLLVGARPKYVKRAIGQLFHASCDLTVNVLRPPVMFPGEREAVHQNHVIHVPLLPPLLRDSLSHEHVIHSQGKGKIEQFHGMREVRSRVPDPPDFDHHSPVVVPAVAADPPSLFQDVQPAPRPFFRLEDACFDELFCRRFELFAEEPEETIIPLAGVEVVVTISGTAGVV